ncbi:MAG: hypothetical protein R3F59_33305 [Myxococcota bacterium]
MSDEVPAPSRTATWRAIALTAVLAVHCVAAAPLPQVVLPEELRTPVAREEVSRWAARLTSLGYAIDADTLGERVLTVSGAIGGAHRRVLAPFRPIFRSTGTGQGWALFANPNIWPFRLEVRVRGASGPWRLLYRRLDPEHPFEDPVIGYRRVRAVYDAHGTGKRPRGAYRRFVAWYAQRVMAEDPSVEQVQIRMVRTHTTIPPRPEDPREEPRFTLVERRP